MSETPDDQVVTSAELAELLAWADEPPPTFEPRAVREARADAVPTEAILADLLEPTFAALRPHWSVSRAECETLAGAYARVVDKYFPDLEVGPELAAVIVTLQIIGPRVAMDIQQPQEGMTHDAER